MTATQVNTTAAQVNTPQTTAPRTTAPRLRLTRRGRVVLTTIFAVPLAALVLATALNGGIATANSDFSSSSIGADSNAGSNGTGSFDYVTVQAGESLWELAESIAPSSDPRDVISDIVRLNQLENSELHPGDQIAVPAKYSR